MTATLTVQRSTRASRVGSALGVVTLGVLVTVPFWLSSSGMRTLVEFLSLLALAQMWNLLAGYAGLVSVGQQAFVGAGAYALIAFGNLWGVNAFLSVLLAGIVALALAIPTAFLAFRLRGGYFAIGTWVIAEVYRLGVMNNSALGGGSGTTLTAVAGIDKATREAVTFWIALAIGAGAIVAVYVILRSKLGLALTALRDSETSADSVGVNTYRVKFVIWSVAAFGTGLAGALIYLNLLRVQPTAAFGIEWMIFMIFIVLIGGIGTVEGPILGTIIFFVLRESLADYGTWFLILLGVLAIVTMLRAPHGVWGLITSRWHLQLFPLQRRLVLATPLDEDEPIPPTGKAPAELGEELDPEARKPN